MPEYGSPAVRRRRLAAELRRLRERAGFTGEEVADRLGWSASKISRIELHRTGVKQADLGQLLDLYHVEDVHRESLVALAKESRRSSRLDVATASLPEDYAAFLLAEAEAQSVWTWEPQIIPGLLQTADYAQAVMLGWTAMFPVAPGEIDRRVEARLLRQQVLNRDPVFMLSVVIDESVLARQLGSPAVMRQQLYELAKLAEPTNITIQVLPLTGEQPVTTGTFTYMKFAQVHDVPLHDMVIMEHLTGSDQIEEEDVTYQYLRSFQALSSAALPEPESVELIRKYARGRWSEAAALTHGGLAGAAGA